MEPPYSALEITARDAERCIQIIRERLPEKARILLLSHTGSRAFGWSWFNFDYDVHGIVACRGYWDWMHLGIEQFDINLYELSHVFEVDLPYRHGETMMNLSNPFYLDGDFPFDRLVGLVTPDFFDELSLEHQVGWFRATRSPRAALHAYRLALVPTYFLRTGRFKLNVFQVAAELGLKLRGLELCRNLYVARYVGYTRSELTDEEYEMVLSEIDKLRSEFLKAKEECPRRWDEAAFEELKSKVYVIYYGSA